MGRRTATIRATDEASFDVTFEFESARTSWQRATWASVGAYVPACACERAAMMYLNEYSRPRHKRGPIHGPTRLFAGTFSAAFRPHRLNKRRGRTSLYSCSYKFVLYIAAPFAIHTHGGCVG